MGQIVTTASFFSNGVTEITGQGKQYRFQVTGTWADEDTLTIIPSLTISGLQHLIGAGVVTGKEPVFALTFKRKLYFLAGTNVYFSTIDGPTQFNKLNGSGNSFIEIANNFATPEDLVALAQYQGKLVVFGRNSTQIWEVAANPLQYNGGQIMDGVGTFAPLSVRALGELDVFYLQATGIRSLRIRDNTLNAFPVDIGSPIDLAVQAKLQSASATERAAACGIVDPASGRYWLFIKDKIYVLSYFPTAKVTAWQTYDASFQTTNVMRVVSGSLGTFNAKIGMTTNVEEAHTNLGDIGVGGSANVTVPGKYLFISFPNNGDLISTTAIPNGVDFRGDMTWDTNLDVVFTPNQTPFTES